MMQKKTAGQSMIEYMAILIMVVLGIFAIGPNVVRSINAFFKGSQQQVEDSFREELTQAPLSGDEHNYDLGNCTCTYAINPVCGDDVYCARNQWMYPLGGCDAACKAKYAAASIPLAHCDNEGDLISQGRTPFAVCYPTIEDYPKSWTLFETLVLNGTCGWGCCRDAVPASPPQCGGTPATKGKLLMVALCGPLLEEQYYWDDNALCGNECTGGKDPKAQWCDPVSYNYDLPSDTQINHVTYGGCAAAIAACAGDPGCILAALHCLAECPDNDGVIGNGISGCTCFSSGAGATHVNYTYVDGECECVIPNYLGDCQYRSSPVYRFVCSGSTVQIIWNGTTILNVTNAGTFTSLCTNNNYYWPGSGIYRYRRGDQDSASPTRYAVCRSLQP